MRLHELHINNFKFFPKQDPKSPLLKIDGKNLLIYGENGSGKSTIYWAIYTLLESAFKINVKDVQKYFSKKDEFGLVNIHATNSQSSFIKMILKDETGNISKEYLVDGNPLQIVSVLGNSDIKESGMASDFLNYQVLFRLHQIKHSKTNNLFGWFEDEIFPYILIESISKTQSIGDFLKDLKKGPKKVMDLETPGSEIFPNPMLRPTSEMTLHQKEVLGRDYLKYKKYENQVKNFNSKFKIFLKDRIRRANEILKNVFQQYFEIQLDFNYAKIKVSSTDLGWEDPEIQLKIPRYEGKLNVIKKAHSFLNEAKWTAIGLSIRFAILEDWINRPATAELKALIIDDMLLSLDMSNRDIVLNMLLERYVNDYQLIFMTHDRSLYEFSKRKIDLKGKNSEWIYLEMFENNLTTFPQPYFKPVQTNLQTARDYFNQHDYPASGIYLRKRIEELLKNLLPSRFKLAPSKNDPNRYEEKILNDLILSLRLYCVEENIDYSGLVSIKTYKDTILNPLAHNDIEAPYYKNELKNLIGVLERLEKIKRGRIVLNANRNCNFILNKPKGVFFSVRMKIKEPIVLIEEDVKSPRISIFTKCKVSSTDNNGSISNEEESFDTVKEVYEEMCNRFGCDPVQDISRVFDYDGKSFDEILISMNLKG